MEGTFQKLGVDLHTVRILARGYDRARDLDGLVLDDDPAASHRAAAIASHALDVSSIVEGQVSKRQRVGPVRFVVADVGHPLRWVEAAEYRRELFNEP